MTDSDKSFDEEIIAIVADSKDRAEKFAMDMGAVDGKYSIVTKYYSVKVPVGVFTRDQFSDPILKTARALILVDDANLLEHSAFGVPEEHNDDIRIFFSSDETSLQRCIDRGFELVLDSDQEECGIPRVRDALKCRAWTDCTSAEEVPEISPESMMDQFDDLLRRVHAVRNSSLPDDERRERAAAIATELATLLGHESE